MPSVANLCVDTCEEGQGAYGRRAYPDIKTACRQCQQPEHNAQSCCDEQHCQQLEWVLNSNEGSILETGFTADPEELCDQHLQNTASS